MQEWGPDVLHDTYKLNVIISGSPSQTICPLWSSIWHPNRRTAFKWRWRDATSHHKIRSPRLFRRTPKIQSTIHMASAGRRWLPLQVKLRHYVMAHWHQRLGEANGSIRGRVKTAGRWQLAFTRSNEGVAGGLINHCYCTNMHACTLVVKCSDHHDYFYYSTCNG